MFGKYRASDTKAITNQHDQLLAMRIYSITVVYTALEHKKSTLDQAVGVMKNNNLNIIRIIIINILAGTFNQAVLSLGLPDYYQHVDFETRGETEEHQTCPFRNSDSLSK